MEEGYNPIEEDETKKMDAEPAISLMQGGESSISDFSENTVAKTKYVSFFSTVMNLLNSLVGAEILSISHSMRYCGLYVSIGLMTTIAILSYVATIMTVKLQNSIKAESLHDLAVNILGNKGSMCLSVLTLLFTYSCCVAYLIIGGDNIKSWFSLLHHTEWNDGWRRKIVMLIYSIILPAALTIPKQMTFLSMFSTFSIFCLAVFVGVIVYKGIVLLPKQGISVEAKAYGLNFGFFNALAIYSLMFALPAIILPILKPTHPSLHRRFKIIGTAFSVCYLFVLIPGVIGYLIFGNTAADILLSSFDDKDILIQCIRIAFFIVVTASYPVIALSITADLSALFFHVNVPNNLPTKQRVIVLLVANIPPIIIAMVCPSISPVLAIGGALGGCLTNFFFPAIMWAKFSKKPRFHISNILCYFFAFFGLASAAIATYRAFIVALHPDASD